MSRCFHFSFIYLHNTECLHYGKIKMEMYTSSVYLFSKCITVNLHVCMDLMSIAAFHFLHSFNLLYNVLFPYQMTLPDFMKITSGILKLLYTNRWTSPVLAEDPPSISQVSALSHWY